MTLARVRFTPGAERDLLRLYDVLLKRDLELAERALHAVHDALTLAGLSPFSCRKANAEDPLRRELVIPFGSSGYVALFRIQPRRQVTILAVRHQREDDLF